MSKLFVLCGPTAVGKGTVVELLRKRYPNQVYVSVSATTRDPRPGEVEGRSYFFVNREQFETLIANGGLLEWAEVHGLNYYGTPREPVLAAISAGQVALLEIDLEGARQVKRNYPQAMLVFLRPPSWEELKHRLLHRSTESPEEQTRRLETARVEMQAIDEFDAVIVNDDLDQTVIELATVMGVK